MGLIDLLVFNTNFCSISAISWREQIYINLRHLQDRKKGWVNWVKYFWLPLKRIEIWIGMKNLVLGICSGYNVPTLYRIYKKRGL